MKSAKNESARPRPPLRRRHEVLDAAARVFHRQGYELTSIQDIADEVGILKGSLYYYIDSKEDLLYEIIMDAHEDALANMRRAEIAGDALQKIRAFVMAHITYNVKNLTRVGVFLHDFRSLNPEHRKRIVEARDVYDHQLRSLIDEGQKEELVCPDVESKYASLAVLGMSNWVYQWYQPRGRLKGDEIAQHFADFVLAGLACDRSIHTPGHRSRLGALPLDFAAPASSDRPRRPSRPRS
jgi:AcrR family transcriptional regulator